MKHNIPHIILTMLIGMAFVSSCTSDPEVTDCATGVEMTFDVETASASRASIITKDNATKQTFNLFGTLNTSKVYINGEYFEGSKTIFDGTQVKYQSSAWNYGTTQYWLLGQEYSFVAVMPFTISGATDMTYSGSGLSFTYTLPSDLNNAIDILAATDRRKFLLNNTDLPKVSFTFSHLLAQINIQVALDEDLMYEDDDNYRGADPDYEDEYIEFHKVEIWGSKTAANFTITPAASSSTNPDPSGTIEAMLIDNATDSKLSKSFTSKKLTNNKEFVSFFSNTDALLIMPQQFAADSEAKMVLTYTVNGNTDRLRQIEIPLAGYKWEAGKTYTYKFTVSKAYTGQIKEGSLAIEINDITDSGANDRWISENDKLVFKFGEK
ncbi:MAG: fimbrillin family protein [Muribaculaceae bacterium]|nr:fimbrillin family protein [Muribaculaceae bacterium]